MNRTTKNIVKVLVGFLVLCLVGYMFFTCSQV